MEVIFEIEYRTEWGQRLVWCSGERRIAMEYRSDGVWRCRTTLAAGDVEYGYEVPADAQLYEILERINALRLCAGDQRIQRADELVIKAHQKCDRAAGNTRHAVRQRHTETMQYGNQFFHVFSFVLSCAVPVRATGTDRVYVQLILLYTFLTCLCNNKSFLYILYFIFIL